MHSPSQLLLHCLELGPHAVAPGLPLDAELSGAGLAEMKVKPRNVKVSGLPSPPGAIGRREAAELEHAGLVRMERQGEFRQPLPQRVEEATSVVLALEAEDQIIGV